MLIGLIKTRVLVFLVCAAQLTLSLHAQELEPRAYSNIPVGMNFVVTGYVYVEGDVLFDVSSPVQDGQLSAHQFVVAYAHALNVLGKSSKIDAIIPFGSVSGSAISGGQYYERDVSGAGDPIFKFTWNFIGAPALSLEEFAKHQTNWILGASLRMTAPLGQYDSDKLLNLGLNRWSFKPELGLSKAWNRWTFEAAGAVTFATANDKFFGNTKREQAPLLAIQGHILYTFGKGIWGGFDATYYAGGRTTLNGIENNDRQSSSRVGLTLSVPLTRQQSFKLYGSTGATARAGGDFTIAGILWQYRWGGNSPRTASTR
ncbi:MAG TPA: transporter [Terriglobia bacterium]|nr:transporter [Terriglobia bacterium]